MLNLKVIKGVGDSIDVSLYERLIQFGEVIRTVFLSCWAEYQVVEDGMVLLRLLKLFYFQIGQKMDFFFPNGVSYLRWSTLPTPANKLFMFPELVFMF